MSSISTQEIEISHADSNLNRIKIAEDNLQTSIQQAKADFEANLVHTFAYNNHSNI